MLYKATSIKDCSSLWGYFLDNSIIRETTKVALLWLRARFKHQQNKRVSLYIFGFGLFCNISVSQTTYSLLFKKSSKKRGLLFHLSPYWHHIGNSRPSQAPSLLLSASFAVAQIGRGFLRRKKKSPGGWGAFSGPNKGAKVVRTLLCDLVGCGGAG